MFRKSKYSDCKIVALFTTDTTVTIGINQATALASNAVPTPATRVQHVTYLLNYYANHSTNCNAIYPGNHTYISSHCSSLGHGSDFGHQSEPPVDPTSQISLYAILLLPIFGYSAVRFRSSPPSPSTRTKFYSHPFSSSRVEVCGQTGGRDQPIMPSPRALRARNS
jgi:hypothetical protein